MKVKVQSRDGRIWDIKPENVGKAFERGGRLVNEDQKIKVQSKGGKLWKIKVKNIPEALRRGGSILDDQEDNFSLLDRAKQFGSGALAGFSSAGLAEAADQFGAGVMEVAPGVVAPILPQSAQVMAKSANKGLEALESMRPDEDDKLGNVLYKSGNFIGATANMPFPSTTAVNYGKSLLSGAAGGGISGGLNQYYGVPEPVADITGIALGNTRPIPAVKLGAQKASDIKIPFASRYNRKIDTKKAERKVSALVNDLTKGKDLEKLNEFKADGLDVVPVTAEVALNNQISGLHNTYAPNSSAILNKQKQNDAVLRSKIDKIGVENYSPTVEEVGREGREFFNTEVEKLKKIREEASAPYYQAQLESQNLYPVTNFETAINQGIADNTGELERTLKRYSGMLPDKNAALLKKLRHELAELQKKSKISSKKSEIDINKLSPAVRKQLMLENPDFQKIGDLEAKIKGLERGKYRPAHIDSTLKNMRNEALKESTTKEERNFLNRYADALEKDLEATDTGSKARRTYKKHSPKINEVEQDEFLNSFIAKDPYGQFLTPAEKLPPSILAAPFDSIRKYGKWTRGSRTDELTRAYLRDKYLGKAVDIEGGVPSYAKSSGFIKQQRPRLEAILDKNEMSELDKLNEYLKNRSIVLSDNSAFGSPTNTKRMLDDITRKYLGDQVIQPHKKTGSVLKATHIPGLKQIGSSLKEITRPNPTYNTLYEFLTDPVYAQKVLKKKSTNLKELMPKHQGYLAQLMGVANNQD